MPGAVYRKFLQEAVAQPGQPFPKHHYGVAARLKRCIERRNMTISNFPSLTIGWVAIATGVAGLLALAFIILLFTVGQPFGALNDLCIGIAAILSAVLAWMLTPQVHDQSPLLADRRLSQRLERSSLRSARCLSSWESKAGSGRVIHGGRERLDWPVAVGSEFASPGPNTAISGQTAWRSPA